MVKASSFLQSLLDQIDHDIVTGTDGRLDRCLALLDQGLGVAQPHVRSVGQTGDPHQVRKILGLCIQEHLHGKIRSELRDAQGPQLAAADVLRA